MKMTGTSAYTRENDDAIALVVCNFSEKVIPNTKLDLTGYEIVLSNYVKAYSENFLPYDARLYIKKKPNIGEI
ncbi:MAG: hypothetical protein MJ171_00755 [Clostridia bacterium]|nr:hypothetical protein [Clostridia bacterium]